MGDKYRFDVRALIRDIGGPTAVSKQFERLGMEVNAPAIKQWARRGRVDAGYVANLFAIRSLDGQPLNFHAYVIPASTIPPPDAGASKSGRPLPSAGPR